MAAQARQVHAWSVVAKEMSMKSKGYLLLAVLTALPSFAQAQLTQPPVSTSRETQQDQAQPEPSRPPNKPKPVPKPKPVVPPPPVRPIYDSKGQLAPHMRQTSPGRVLDTRTNRYYDTVPSGIGQKVVPPPAGTR
ncbi:hypothetical protein [Stenotrophomonas sp. UBA7606]|uniref:hypothetical protein n=1 Tax=Stenotrophomonas sp. UBA7606 TaxID=1947559 RepID=UPI0025D8F94E|nr:hypothetical protein [Stenotrophomonas sp. UBA7606]